MRKIAIYDLDRTLLKHATFTPFLLHAARRRRPWRLVFVPVWLGAMLAYKAGAMSRGALKQFGLSLFLGKALEEGCLRDLSQGFCTRVVPRWIGEGAARALARDRAEGRMLVLASAAMEFYAADIATARAFDHVVATRHRSLADGSGACRIEGGNCYGPAKPPRMEMLLAHLGLERGDCDIRFYSDSVSDAPLLDWADEGVLVDPGVKAAKVAAQRGWQTARFSA